MLRQQSNNFNNQTILLDYLFSNF